MARLASPTARKTAEKAMPAASSTLEGSVISMQDIFVRPAHAEGASDPLRPAGLIPNCYQKIIDSGQTIDRGMFLLADEVGSANRWR